MPQVVVEGGASREGLVAFNQHEGLRLLGQFDAQSTPVDWVRTLLIVHPVDLTRLGQRMVELDRALRRYVAFREPGDAILRFGRGEVEVRGERTTPSVYPVSVDQAGLRVLDAAPGSVNLWLEPFGLLGTILASQPATAMANALQILDAVGRVTVWARRRTPLSRLSAEDAFRVAQDLNTAIGELDRSRPDAIVSIGEPAHYHKQPRGRVRLPDGTYASGRTVRIIRRHPDGTVDIIQAEG